MSTNFHKRFEKDPKMLSTGSLNTDSDNETWTLEEEMTRIKARTSNVFIQASVRSAHLCPSGAFPQEAKQIDQMSFPRKFEEPYTSGVIRFFREGGGGGDRNICVSQKRS